MVSKKTERVTIRFSEKDYEFLQDIASDLDVPLAQLIRRICTRFWMKYIIGDVEESFDEVRKNFLEKVQDYIDKVKDDESDVDVEE